jgi:hypothetical protein
VLVVDPRELLPAFVIGYDHLNEPEHAPPWSLEFDHQYGGYSCLHVRLSGCLLRLAANADALTPKMWLLARALGELGEMWWPAEAPETKELREEIEALVHYPSWGEELTPPDVADLTRLFAGTLGTRESPAPPVERGSEALIKFAEFPTLSIFDGWRFTAACACGQLHESTRYSREIADALPGARLFLVWENSD